MDINEFINTVCACNACHKQDAKPSQPKTHRVNFTYNINVTKEFELTEYAYNMLLEAQDEGKQALKEYVIRNFPYDGDTGRRGNTVGYHWRLGDVFSHDDGVLADFDGEKE